MEIAKKRILFVSCDPGGTNCLIPIIKYLRNDFECVVYGKLCACKAYKGERIPCSSVEDIDDESEMQGLKKLLEKLEPDLVLTGTSADDFTERKLWKLCRNAGIASVAVLDAWVNYGIRFSAFAVNSKKKDDECNIEYTPDFVLVMDEESRKAMVEVGHNPERIRVTGQPFLEYVWQKYSDVLEEQIASYKFEINAADKKIILYLSDNLRDGFPTDGEPYWGYDEVTTFEFIIKVINETCKKPDDYLLIIRPHPKESVDEWKIRAADSKCSVEIRVDNGVSGEIAILSSDIVIGMFSMMMTEAALAGKPVYSVQLSKKHDPGLFLENRQLLTPFTNYEAFLGAMNEYFVGGYTVKPVQMEGYFDNSIERTCNFIKELLLDYKRG